MRIQHFTPAGRTTINWASGTSTELFIYPADGSFAERNFLFRISTATVEAEESVFTFFEGITRHLMILKGSLELIHEGKYTRHLKPYEQDVFSGEWSTRSKGRVTDFNLMLKGGTKGTLTHQRVEPGISAEFTCTTDFCFIYFAFGSADIGTGNKVAAEDLLQISKGATVQVTAATVCELVRIEVTLG